MNYDIRLIISSEKKVVDSTNRLLIAINGDWNDSVKESYRRYISQSKEVLDKIRQRTVKLKSTCETVERIRVDAIILSAESICSQIEGF